MKRLFLSSVGLVALLAASAVLRSEAVMQTSAAQTGTASAGKPSPDLRGSAASAGKPNPEPRAPSPESHGTLLTTHCYSCHNPRVKMGGLTLQGLDIQQAGAEAEVWEKVVRKLRGRLMPPPGSPQPAQGDIDTFVAWMEGELDRNPRAPTAGYVGLQRLSRTEYAAAVKALVGVEIVARDVLPQDAVVEGFDNIAHALNVSPTFMEQYVEAARTIARKAIGDRSLDSTSYALTAHRGVEAMPLGLRDGGLRLTHNFPVDGEYRFNVLFPDGTLGLYTGSLENEATLVLMIDGKVLFRKPIGGLYDLMLNNRKAGDGRQEIADRFRNITLQIGAGVREVVVGFVDRTRFESPSNTGGGGGLPSFNSIEIKGPYNPTGDVSTEGRRLLYVCDPKVAGEGPCATQIASTLARRAFRRPVTDADLARLMPFYEAGRKERDFDRGIERLVAAVLVSPDFMYRAIRGASSAQGAEHPLSDYELATRLSFFLWNTGPDETLFTLAASHELSNPATLDAQVTRMLADPKATSLVTNFATRWLGLDGLDGIKPDDQIFVNFTDALRQDMVTEAQVFIRGVLLDENRPIVELLTSNRTYLNDRIARHYGMTGVNGAQFRWVTLTDPNRLGLLGKGAILMRTSYPDRTSPVLRGSWALEKIIGAPPSPPPPGVESNLSQTPGEAPRTVRARLEQHRASPACGQCHGVIDPMGLALENFDAVGAFRTVDRQAANAPIDVSTVLPSGLAMNGPVELRQYLAGDPARFAQAFTEKLLMYAVNRELEYFDMPQVRAVVRGAAKSEYTLSSLVQGIVRSDAFLKQGAPGSHRSH
jgi:hypothetical protein